MIWELDDVASVISICDASQHIVTSWESLPMCDDVSAFVLITRRTVSSTKYLHLSYDSTSVDIRRRPCWHRLYILIGRRRVALATINSIIRNVSLYGAISMQHARWGDHFIPFHIGYQIHNINLQTSITAFIGCMICMLGYVDSCVSAVIY